MLSFYFWTDMYLCLNKSDNCVSPRLKPSKMKQSLGKWVTRYSWKWQLHYCHVVFVASNINPKSWWDSDEATSVWSSAHLRLVSLWRRAYLQRHWEMNMVQLASTRRVVKLSWWSEWLFLMPVFSYKTLGLFCNRASLDLGFSAWRRVASRHRLSAQSL